MLCLTTVLILILSLISCAKCQILNNEGYQSTFCSKNEKCSIIENCSAMLNLMERNALSIPRFRQSICGYDNAKPKICCEINGNSVNPPPVEEDGISFVKPNTISECGKSVIRSNINTVGTHPFVVRIGFIAVAGEAVGEIKYSCSGVIINERTILTTASCALATSTKYKLYTVLVGEFNTDTDPDCNSVFCGHKVRSHNISYVIKHPNYQGDSFTNNIALLRLEDSIQYTATAQPACLPRVRYINVGSSSTLVGWGKLEKQETKPGQQQALKMKIVPNQQCSSYYNQGFSVELCAIGDEIPCSGYNGSPLLYKYGDTNFLLGILSYGSSCNSNTNFPSVFVNTQRYVRWILENC